MKVFTDPWKVKEGRELVRPARDAHGLTADERRAVKGLHLAGWRSDELADLYGVPPAVIVEIIRTTRMPRVTGLRDG